MSSRDAILQRIRTELSKSASPERPEVPEVWPRTNPDPAAMVSRFVEEIEAVQGEVVHCANMDDAGAKLVELMDSSEWPSIRAVDTPLSRELLGGLFVGFEGGSVVGNCLNQLSDDALVGRSRGAEPEQVSGF